MIRQNISLRGIAAGGVTLAAVWALVAQAQPQQSTERHGGSSGMAGGIGIKHTLTLEGANRVIAAALAKAGERGAGGAVAVVDDGGNLMALQRLDGTFAAGSAVSIGKARTAAIFKKPTRAFEESINGGRIALSAVSEMTPLQGGIPIMHEGFIIGGIGVSGAHSQMEDEEIAIAGAAAIVGDDSPQK